MTDDVLAQPALRDGVVVPVDAVPVAIAVRRDGSSGPRAIDPIATPGILSVEEQGAPIWVGSGVPLGGLGELEVDEPDHHGVPRPSLLTFAAAAAAGAPAPATARRGGDALRLVVHRSLYDRGTVVAASPSLAPLAPDQVLTVNPAELARLGLDGAARVVVRSEHGELEVEVAGDAELPPGLAVLGANLAAANALGIGAGRRHRSGDRRAPGGTLMRDPLFAHGVDLGGLRHRPREGARRLRRPARLGAC